MKQKIYYNSDDYTGSGIVWFLLLCLVFCCFFWWTPSGTTTYATNSWNWGWSWWGWLILGILFFWWICALFYTPLDVTADDDEVRIRRPFKTKRIRMDEIQSAEPYQVSGKPNGKFLRSAPMKTFGRWGQYRDNKIGDYFAYYGKPDNTVLITLKDGRKYIVGGEDAKAMSDYINSKTNNSNS